ncbi:MAG: hypothetical protein U0Q21_06595 [Dermatophilaceae bacterium]
MILRSRRAGSALTFRGHSAGTGQGSAGIIAETGPSGGVLTVYADGTLVTKIDDLRSSEVVTRRVIALVPLTDFGLEWIQVNLRRVPQMPVDIGFDCAGCSSTRRNGTT